MYILNYLVKPSYPLCRSCCSHSSCDSHTFPSRTGAREFQPHTTNHKPRTINMDTGETARGGIYEPCFMLCIRDESKNEKTAVDSGYTEDNPLTLHQGTYELLIMMAADNYPFKYPQLHMQVDGLLPKYRRLTPFFNTDEPSDVAVIFRSESGPEKSERRSRRVPTDEQKMSLGSHRLGLGDLNILVVGSVEIDYLGDEVATGVEYIIKSVPVNLSFWLRVVDVGHDLRR